MTTDNRPTPTLWKILNGYNSATAPSIQFLFGSKVGFSAKQIESVTWKIQYGGWQPFWNDANGISPKCIIHPIHV